MTSLFAMGMTLSLFADQRDRVRAKLEQTEHPVVLPILALAGAHIEVQSIPAFAAILPIALIVRVVFTAVVAGAAQMLVPTVASGGIWFGPSMFSSGALTVCIAFACALHAPGLVGQMILVAAVVDTVAGEVIGPIALRRALRHAQEEG